MNFCSPLSAYTPDDIFKSTVHRAINRTGVRRYSIPLFFGTDYDVKLEVRGFIVLDAVTSGKMGPYMGELIKGVKEGKIKLGDEVETVVDTKFEDIPNTWMMLFKGGNQGKLVTAIKA